MAKKESRFQSDLIKDIQKLFPEAIITKTDANYIQGFPDILILNGNTWAALECKKEEDAEHQPNQDDYVELLNKMSYSSFVYPENRKEVLNDLQQTFGS